MHSPARHSVPDPLGHFLKTYCNVDDCLLNELSEYVSKTEASERTQLFRTQLAEAIAKNTITPEQYEALTYEDFDSQEALNKWLKELWLEIYGVEFN